MNPVFDRLFSACEQSGIALAKDHKDEILGLADGIADAWLDKVVSAIADNLPAGGVKSVEWGPIKGALLASSTQIDEATNEQISALFDKVLAALQH